MLRKVILKGGGRELALPVTPEKFTVSFGAQSETVNIHEVGDVDVGGNMLLDSPKLEFMLPANDYPFADAQYTPYEYIALIQKWIKKKTILRYVIPDTSVNISVRIVSVEYGEADGTNDVYGTLTMRQHRTLAAVQVESTAANNKQREGGGNALSSDIAYNIKYGDTMCAICRRYYGNDKPATYNALARYNGIANANIIMAGQNINIPNKAKLGV